MAKKRTFLICLMLAALWPCCAAGQSNHQKIPYIYEIYITKAITNAKILPRSFPIPGTPDRLLTITACRGEYEPASFAVHALNDIKNMVVTATDLKSENSSIPASAVDIRVVKCWFQAGVALNEKNKCILTPELLLKDDKLIYVDLLEKKNFLRSKDSQGKTNYILISDRDSENLEKGYGSQKLRDIQPQDASTLQPVDLDVGSVKQFWVTVQVPEDATPGRYEGKIKLVAANIPPNYLTLRLQVLPFALEKPVLRYSIFYTGQLTNLPPEARIKWAKDGRAIITDKWKSPQQYYAEMKDLKAHGVEYPTLEHYDHEEKDFDAKIVRQMLEIRANAGLPKGTLYSMGIRTFNPTEPDKIAALRTRVQRYLALVKEFGYEDLYVYGIDEAKGDLLKSQRPAWTAVHQAGAKMFVACYTGSFEAMGDILDLAVYCGPFKTQVAQQFHAAGHQIFSYGNPQVGMEEPETYRRNYGLLLWKAGYDGAMDFAYQADFTHIWNDFDDKRFRDHVFAYPTVDGVIDTIEWEGFREGVDDVRYLTTLLKAIKEAGAAKSKQAAEAQAWVDNIDPQSDLDMLRSKMIGWILKLQ